MSTTGERAGGELNLKQVAATLGVHYMTAYRYVRQGRLEATRVGTEWRVTADIVRDFIAGNPSGIPRDPDLSDSGRASVNWAERLERCLIAGDETAAWRVIENSLAAGKSPEYCYVEMVARALGRIEERSRADELAVADPYVATAVTSRIIARLGARFRRPGRTRGNVVFGAPRGEFHTVPIAIYSDLLRLAGFDVLELGADVPVEAFVESVRATERLVCVGVGVTQAEALNAGRLVIQAVRLVNPQMPIGLGGLAARIPGIEAIANAEAIAGDGSDVVAVVEQFSAMRAAQRFV